MSIAVESVSARSRFLDLRALAALEHMRFATRHQIDGIYAGRHRSRQPGGAAEFVDYREYSSGEDLRRLDWKVLARTGRPYVRLYQDETNLLCTMLIDASGSMAFGGEDKRSESGSKLEYIQYLATAISHVIMQQQDHIGLAVIADKLMELIPPGGTSAHVRRVQQSIENLKTVPATALGDGLREIFTRLARRGVLMIMSDFLVEDMEDVFAAVRLFRHRRWEVIVLHVIHPQEEHLPDGLAFQFAGLENDGRIDCTPAEIRHAYEDRFESHIATVRSMALAGGCDYRRVSTSVPYLRTLGGFLVERSG